MRPRFAHFAHVPVWVVNLPTVYGNASVIATYVAVRVIAFENPDRRWKSERDLAVCLGEAVGVGSEAVRKHLRVLRNAGAITGGAGELFLPSDDPQTGDGSGDGGPQNGEPGTQNGDGGPHAPIYKEERSKKVVDDAKVGTVRANIHDGICCECERPVKAGEGRLVGKKPAHLRGKCSAKKVRPTRDEDYV